RRAGSLGARGLLRLLPGARHADGADLPVGLPAVRVHAARAVLARDQGVAPARSAGRAGAAADLVVPAADLPADVRLRQTEVHRQPTQRRGLPEGLPDQPTPALADRLVRPEAAGRDAEARAAVHVPGRDPDPVLRVRAGLADADRRRLDHLSDDR